MEKLIEKTKEAINEILDTGINGNNIKNLGELVDIYKDIKEVECMQYGNYGNYGRNSYGENYGNYGRGSYGDNYGRRGYDAKYRGESALEAMRGNYRAYSASNESYGAGNYGSKEDSMKNLRYMLESAMDFFNMLKAEAKSQKELTLIHDYVNKINEM